LPISSPPTSDFKNSIAFYPGYMNNITSLIESNKKITYYVNFVIIITVFLSQPVKIISKIRNGGPKMLFIKNLRRQHDDIMEIVDRLFEYIKKDSIREYVKDIARDVNVLSGKLRIHLQEEDRVLYPMMEKSDDRKIRKSNECYQREMKDLFDLFNQYKNKYNISGKILDNTESFIKETEQILSALKKRIEKENNELYPSLAKKN